MNVKVWYSKGRGKWAVQYRAHVWYYATEAQARTAAEKFN